MAEVATAADTGDRGPQVDSAVDALRRSILAIRGGPEVVAPFVVVALLAAVQWSPVRFLRYVSAPVGVYLVARRGPGSIETETGSTPVGLRVLVALLAAVVAALATSVGFVLLVLPGLYLLVRFYLVVPAVVLDDAGPLEALGRSWERTDGNVTTVAGVVGMTADSILGATLEGTRLGNQGVNLLATLTAGLAAAGGAVLL